MFQEGNIMSSPCDIKQGNPSGFYNCGDYFITNKNDKRVLYRALLCE